MSDPEYNILIVDDIPQNIQVLGSILKKAGYAISYATSGKQALSLIESEAFDLVLLDVMMPQMDGFEVCRKIQALLNGQELPIVFLTAKTEKEDIVKGFEVGAVDYIAKPFNSAELLARVRTHLALKHSRVVIEEKNTELANKNEELKTANADLEKALREIKTLQGILPICSHCKKIRKDGAEPERMDSWVSLELYIYQNTEAALSHSICPECSAKYYDDLDDT